MLVAIVTAPFTPALAIIAASFAWFLAFNVLCLIPFALNILDKISDVSTATVPRRIG